MSGSLNKVTLIATLGKDPEIRAIPNGSRVANFTVATNETYKDKSGATQKSTEWHRLVVWGKLVDIIEKYLKKGDTAYFEGKLTTRKWEDKDGVTKYSTEVVVYSMQLLGGKSSSSGQSKSEPQGGGMPFEGPDNPLPF